MPGGFPEIPQEGIRHPAWNLARFNPADNRQVAALRTEKDTAGLLRCHLYVLNTATRRRKRLVRDVGCGLSWSRTGWLALERNGQLWKIKASGDSLTRLTTGTTVSSQPAWSPAGRLLACLQRSTDSVSRAHGIAVLTPTGRVVKRLSLGEIYVIGGLTWSPDGRKLAFRGGEERAINLYEYELKTGRLRIRYDFLGYQYGSHSVHWLPNGKELLWRHTRNGLMVINLATQAQRTVWSWSGGEVYPLSLDLDATGRRLLVVSADGRPIDPDDPQAGGYMEAIIFTANLDGSRRVRVQ